MKTDTSSNIIAFLQKHERATPKVIIEHLRISPQAVFRQLKQLIEDGAIKKQGRPPKVFYCLAQVKVPALPAHVAPDAEQIIRDRFFKITSEGVRKQGVEAFTQWCQARGLDPVKASIEYMKTCAKYDAYKKDGFIDGMQKLTQTFPTAYLDQLYYLDFYSIERFGKTKLGELILYAKQSQDRALMREIVVEIRVRIAELVERKKIDAICFVPATVKREIQLMKELEEKLHLPMKTIKVTKIKTPIVVPQKTLGKLEERIGNARESLVVETNGYYGNILIIDDAVGSGATMQEVARQIRRQGICTGSLIGLGLTGSFNGFDVIQEV